MAAAAGNTIWLIFGRMRNALPSNLDNYCKFHYTTTRDQSITLWNVFDRDEKNR